MLFPISIIALIGLVAVNDTVATPEARVRDLSSNIFDNDILQVIGVLAGANAKASSSGYEAWIGTDGSYTAEFVNKSGEDFILVIWESTKSWIGVDAPLITYPLSDKQTLYVSFTQPTSGAWAAIYSDTTLVQGQISETWGEFTFDDKHSTVDVSREVNMQARGMSIETEGCISNMTTCVFQCTDDAASCWYDYELVNCATGSQTGAEYGMYAGAASGGCLVGPNKHVQTIIS